MSTKENSGEVAVEKVTENDKPNADAKSELKGIKRAAEVSTEPGHRTPAGATPFSRWPRRDPVPRRPRAATPRARPPGPPVEPGA